MTTFDGAHGRLVVDRRSRVLASHLKPLFPERARVLDVGAGDGKIAAILGQSRPDIEVIGIDPLVRPETHIPVLEFDGATFPFEDHFFDVAIFIDVLHHTADPQPLLDEAARVTRDSIIIKDHYRQGILGEQLLRFMDDVGNKRHGVGVTYNYLSPAQWDSLFERTGYERVFEECRVATVQGYRHDVWKRRRARGRH